jgi:hypothetical protein
MAKRQRKSSTRTQPARTSTRAKKSRKKPTREAPNFPAEKFSGVMGQSGDEFYKYGKCQVKAGCPQMAYDLQTLPKVAPRPEQLHWMLRLWHHHHGKPIYEYTGFRNYTDDSPPRVQVVLRNIGSEAPNADPTNPIHQTDGWFRFRVKLDGNDQQELYFELVLDEPMENEWKAEPLFCWDWGQDEPSGLAARQIFRPVYRVLRAGKRPPDAWKLASKVRTTRSKESSESPNDPNSFGCIFKCDDPDFVDAGPDDYVEIAQGIPYTLDDWEYFRKTMNHNYPHHVRQRKIGSGGLRNAHPDWREVNDIYALEIKDPDLPAKPTVFLVAGQDYEPPGNWVCHGFVNEVLHDPEGRGYLNHFSVAAVGVANPDAHSWGCSHVVPYGNGHAPIWWWWRGSPDPEWLGGSGGVEHMGLCNYMNQLRFGWLDVGSGMRLNLSLHADLAPHPARWKAGRMGPPIYGYYKPGLLSGNNQRIDDFVQKLQNTPTCGPYVRPFADWAEANIMAGHEDAITLEYDESVLYRTVDANPGEMPAGQLLAPDSDPYGGYKIDGNVTTARTYMWFGRDLAKAVLQSYFS